MLREDRLTYSEISKQTGMPVASVHKRAVDLLGLHGAPERTRRVWFRRYRRTYEQWLPLHEFGLSGPAIAKKLGINYTTMRYHLAAYREHLECNRSSTQAPNSSALSSPTSSSSSSPAPSCDTSPSPPPTEDGDA